MPPAPTRTRTRSAKRPKPTKRRAAARPASAGAKWRLRAAKGIEVLEAPQLARLRFLVHGFSTRIGGASELPADRAAAPRRTGSHKALNLGLTDWDTYERVLENRKRFFSAIGAGSMRLVILRQIHSDSIHRIDANPHQPPAAPSDDPPLRGDALITRDPGILLIVQTADCVPILLADMRRHAVAAIHAGWRGTARRIAAKALGRMQMEFGTQPADVVAALGPSIAQCSYEVGADVVKEFHAQFPAAREWFDGPFDALASNEDPNPLPWLTMRPPGHPPPDPRVQLDLIAANRAILADAGVPASQISSSGFCTACRTDLFFSYRRECNTGRMMAAIGLRAA